MTAAEKKAAIDAAWAQYRAASQAIPRQMPWSAYKRNGVRVEGFIETDERLWRTYLARERDINAVPTTKAA